jgi:hypothetical protein
MKRIGTEAIFQCEVCGKIGIEVDIAFHEDRCRKRKEAEVIANMEYRRKKEERIKRAEDWAKSSRPVLLLLTHGYRDEAKTLCQEWANWSVGWDCGTSSGWEEVYEKMLLAAESVVLPGGGWIV